MRQRSKDPVSDWSLSFGHADKRGAHASWFIAVRQHRVAAASPTAYEEVDSRARE